MYYINIVSSNSTISYYIHVIYTNITILDWSLAREFFILFAKDNNFDPRIASNWYSVNAELVHCRPVLLFFYNFINIMVLGKLRVLRVKRRKLRVTGKTRNPNRKMYGFTRKYA